MRRLALTLLVLTIAAAPAAAQDAADAYYDPAEMAKARHMLRHHHGGGALTYFEGERLEVQSGGSDPLFLWDVQGWYGNDRDKLWLKSEGEAFFDGGLEHAEIQGLYSRAIGSFFDLQGGVRRDFGPDRECGQIINCAPSRAGPSRTHAVIGVQGLAPYLFEIDAAMFISGHGEVTARIEAEYEFFLTQRLILQPRTELNFSAQDIPALETGAGLTSAEAGARLRYEVTRQLAPYVGVSWARDIGRTADYTRAAGEDPGSVSFVAGLRVWF